LGDEALGGGMKEFQGKDDGVEGEAEEEGRRKR
jgi:hypothetical protein